MLDAAAIALAANAGASVADIADQAGLSRATAYRHFPDTDSIRAALAKEAEEVGRELVQERLAALFDDSADGVPILDMVMQTIEAALPLRHRWTIAISGQPVPDDGLITTFAPMARAVLRRGQVRGEIREDLDLDVTAEALIAITLYAVRRVHSDGLDPGRAIGIVQPFMVGITRGARRP
jgi:TetR/AcrR family transcriptional repressor of mexCD-oprJ operon